MAIHNPLTNSSNDQMDRVDRARLVDSCGARDDSPSRNLGPARQGDTVRVGGASRRSPGQKDVKESEQGVLQIAKRGTRPRMF